MRLLYKYLSPERVDVLGNGMIRFSPPGSFNDPFELSPSFSGAGTPEEIRDVFEQTSDEEMVMALEEVGKIGVPGSVSELAAIAQLLFHEGPNAAVSALLNKSVGILSLTERRDSLLMWAHYAASHTGFVVGFNGEHEYFRPHTAAGQELGHVRKVEYCEDRPRGSVASLTGAEVFLRKSPHWEYEQEWRIIRPLNEATKVLPDVPHEIHLFQFPAEAVAEVVLGCRMANGVRTELCKTISDDRDLARATVLQAEIDEHKYRLRFNSVAV